MRVHICVYQISYIADTNKDEVDKSKIKSKKQKQNQAYIRSIKLL